MPEKHVLKVGDCVRLKSGSPIMIVEKIDAIIGVVLCIWMSKNNKIQRYIFNPILLVLHTDSWYEIQYNKGENK